MASTPGDKSDTLHFEGDVLHKHGYLIEGIHKYIEALTLMPNSLPTLRSLSIAWFDLGKYQFCQDTAKCAIKLEKELGADDKNFQLAKLNDLIDKAKVYINDVPDPEKQYTRLLLAERLPKYKASIPNRPIYSPVGRHVIYSLFDETVWLEKNECVSFFFGGVGDARSLFYTIVKIAEAESRSESRKTIRYQFLANDHNINVLARDLIIISLIQELAQAKKSDRDLFLNTIFYIYSAQIMPMVASDHLIMHMKGLIELLAKGRLHFLWLSIYRCDVPKIVAVYKSWIKAAKSIDNIASIIDSVKSNLKDIHDKTQDLTSETPPELKDEKDFYTETAMLLPSEDMYDIHPDFQQLVKTTPMTKNNVEKYKKYLSKNWKFNVTLIDSNDWDEASPEDIQKPETLLFYAHDPFDLSLHLQGSVNGPPCQGQTRRTCLYDYVAPFFCTVAKSIRQLRGRFHIEFVLGDYTDVCEHIQYRSLHHGDDDDDESDCGCEGQNTEPSSPSSNSTSSLSPSDSEDLFGDSYFPPSPTKKCPCMAADDIDLMYSSDDSMEYWAWEPPRAFQFPTILNSRPNRFPDKFDRVFLNSVPDSACGRLSTFLYAPYILKRKSPVAYIAANCNARSDNFEIKGHQTHLRMAFDMLLTEFFLPMPLNKGKTKSIKCRYSYYGTSSPAPHIFDKLLTRDEFVDWFYGLFFRLALPVPIRGENPVRDAPLNLTIIPRLVSQLVQMGYRALWIADCLENILSDNVITIARPPYNYRPPPANRGKKYPPRKLVTAPFVPELSMILAAFSPLLPFSISTSPLTLPSLKNIYQVKFKLAFCKDISADDAHTNTIALVCCDRSLFNGNLPVEKLMTDPRPLLDSTWDEVNTGYADRTIVEIRAKGIIFFTTIELDFKKGTINVWMKESVVDKMLRDDCWSYSLVKTDTWNLLDRLLISIDSTTIARGMAWGEQESWAKSVVTNGHLNHLRVVDDHKDPTGGRSMNESDFLCDSASS